ncbi:MAG TPA: AbrB/MazE/SpoVT family DNA-binding domain-containing protein [Candidatus Acidoferrales bacterium]|nr:AbrB/MazE/SpoVT family DNA-binding domain-containing protein [Candidatus Acidoferrales bacterium]
MTFETTLDKAGRLALPKPLLDKMRLGPGDRVLLESEGEQIILRPERPPATLKKKRGVWVYQGEPSRVSLPVLIEREREKRLRKLHR